MPNYKVVDAGRLDAAMTATADSIRAKTGGTSTIPWDSATGFKSAVEEIRTDGGTEDLSAELEAQDELISALEEAVAGKAAGGGTIELCKVTVEHNVVNGVSALWVIAYTTVSNGEIMSVAIEDPPAGTNTYSCIKGSIVTVFPNNDFYSTCIGSAESLIESSYGIFRITGDATISAEPMD